MTEKQFKVTNISENGNIGLFWLGKDNLSVYDVVRLLNELYNENEQLNQEYLKLKHRHSLLHDVCLDAECERDSLKNDVNSLEKENVQLKAQLYCDDEEGVCNICKHHYLVKDDETELGYYNSRCKKGHYECARVSLKYCDDFELKGDMND